MVCKEHDLSFAYWLWLLNNKNMGTEQVSNLRVEQPSLAYNLANNESASLPLEKARKCVTVQ